MSSPVLMFSPRVVCTIPSETPPFRGERPLRCPGSQTIWFSALCARLPRGHDTNETAEIMLSIRANVAKTPKEQEECRGVITD